VNAAKNKTAYFFATAAEHRGQNRNREYYYHVGPIEENPEGRLDYGFLSVMIPNTQGSGLGFLSVMIPDTQGSGLMYRGRAITAGDLVGKSLRKFSGHHLHGADVT